MGRTGKDVTVFVGNSAFPILATAGGIVEHLVKLNDKVKAGQKVAIQRDSFGEVVAEYGLHPFQQDGAWECRGLSRVVHPRAKIPTFSLEFALSRGAKILGCVRPGRPLHAYD